MLPINLYVWIVLWLSNNWTRLNNLTQTTLLLLSPDWQQQQQQPKSIPEALSTEILVDFFPLYIEILFNSMNLCINLDTMHSDLE